jgi:hypothetical protein
MKILKFIHITKSAGTSIEAAAFKKGIKWGKHHQEYGFWHDYFPNKPNKLKQGFDWFMVVRNPYSRLISEYNWISTNENRSILKSSKEEIVSDFNKFLAEKVKMIGENKQLQSNERKGHFNKQSRYLDDCTIITVLKFENIEAEFNLLMKLYNINLTLNSHLNRSETFLTIKDINNFNIALINDVYKDDFAFFGYKMLESRDEDYDGSGFIPLPEFSLKNVRSVYDLERSMANVEE